MSKKSVKPCWHREGHPLLPCGGVAGVMPASVPVRCAEQRTGADANSLRSCLALAVGAAHRGRSAFALSGGMPCNTIRDMKIHEFIWPEDQVAHIVRHGVRPEEVEDVCFGRALVQRTKSAGEVEQVDVFT